MIRLHPRSPLFPYTTLFRSRVEAVELDRRRLARLAVDPDRALRALRWVVDPADEVPGGRAPVLKLAQPRRPAPNGVDRKSTRLNSSHGYISYAVFCLKKKKN